MPKVRALEKYPLAQADREDMPATQRLRTFIHYVMSGLFEEGLPAWRFKLMAREMIEPTAALDAMVENMIRPMARKLESIVRELLGSRGDRRAGSPLPVEHHRSMPASPQLPAGYPTAVSPTKVWTGRS